MSVLPCLIPIDSYFLTAMSIKLCAASLRFTVKGKNHRIGRYREKHQEETFHLKRKGNTVMVKTV